MFSFDARTRALLRAIDRSGSISAAARELQMDASNARRHIRTAEARAGEPLVVARRGGAAGGTATLTTRARRFARPGGLVGVVGAFDPARGVTEVRVAGHTLLTAGRQEPGHARVRIAPESVMLQRPRPDEPRVSARNRILARVHTIAEVKDGVYRVSVVAGRLRLTASLVRGAIRELCLRPGSRVVVLIKAPNIHVET